MAAQVRESGGLIGNRASFERTVFQEKRTVGSRVAKHASLFLLKTGFDASHLNT
jgi:hypothetical protein